VAFIGDSITHSGLAVAYIQEYYLTHMPERGVKIYNLGIGGDQAAHCCARIDEILSVKPTEAVVMFGVNDMGVQHYGSAPTPENLAARERARRIHLEGTVRLVTLLREAGLKVTLCSAVGRDEHTVGTEGLLTFGATDALHAMYYDNIAAIGDGVLKNTVDYLAPMQALQAALCAIGGPSLFAVDRTHPSPLGQRMMARIFLAAQGLPVALPSAEALADGWCERPLPDALAARRAAGLRLRDLHWVYPHQQDRTKGLDLEGRIAFCREELNKPDLSAYSQTKYKNYIENARREEEFFSEYMRLTDALYGDTDGKIDADAKVALRI
jgi:lysophospholipase L1-like esterase